MKIKTISISITLIILAIMWHFSPMQTEKSKPSVTTIFVKTEDIYDTVVARGSIEERTKKTIRLDQNSVVEQIYVSVGDFVNSGAVLLDVSEKDFALSDYNNITNYFPRIDDISDIKDFYIPQAVDPTTSLTPQIKAPISGIITNITVKEGDIALGQLPIITISDFNDLCIKASVSELYVKNIKVGQRAEVSSDAFPGKKYVAQVSKISPFAQKNVNLTGTSETTVEITLDLISKNADLRPGYSVNVKVFTQCHNDAITVPYTCVFQEEDREYVYTVNNGKLSKKAIRTGFELDDRVEVVSGIEEKDMIVVNPSDELANEMLVKAGTQ